MIFTGMTFNLRYNTPKDGDNIWAYRADCAAEMIRSHDPLVVGTQEGYLAMLNDLQDRLADYAWIGQGRMGGTENEHNAVFYKRSELAVLDKGQFWLSETPLTVASKSWDSNLPRICTWIRFRSLQSGRQFLVYNTHLDHMGQEARINGAKLIWDSMQSNRLEFGGIPALLLGDMNSRPSELPIRFFRGETGYRDSRTSLKDAYTALPGAIGLTAHEFKGGDAGEPIDYIFVSPDVEVLETKVDRRQVRGRYPSDHYPVVAKVRIGGSV